MKRSQADRDAAVARMRMKTKQLKKHKDKHKKAAD